MARFRSTHLMTIALHVSAAISVPCCFMPDPVRAGGGPENVLIVVNSRSESSKTIANHYTFWRRIPPANVVYLDWQWGIEDCTADHFRKDLLEPILDCIDRRGIKSQIDYIVYSSDFPWRIHFKQDFQSPPPPKQLNALLSLTGATYLWEYAATKNPKLLALDNNHYVPHRQISVDRDNPARLQTPSHGFRSEYGWKAGGKRVASGGTKYYLSTMLAVTSGRGMRVEQALDYLNRSIRADGIPPRGTIYFMQRDEIRSKVRHGLFPGTVDELKALGVRAEICSGTLPSGKQDIAGLMVGAAKFDLDQADVKILPGAICDHLTSSGGILRKDASQTPLTEFLCHGAAGACGAVVEPYAIAQKFPLPSLHVHYVHGCSLAEAFYQSVAGPFQLLIVGDPLCQPWAGRATVKVDGIASGQTVRGEIACSPTARFPNANPAKYFELFVDGIRTERVEPGDSIHLDTQSLADGYHELRIVAVEAGPIERQGRLRIPIQVDNHGLGIDVSISPQRRVAPDDILELTARAEGAEAIEFRHQHRLLGRIEGSQGTLRIEAATLGPGPCELHIQTMGSRPIVAKPIEILVM